MGSAEMNLAAVLSDLTSLRVCDPAAATALVSARPASASPMPQEGQTAQKDGDLARVEALLQLHRTVKLAYSSGSRPGNFSDEFKELYEARVHVRNSLQQLNSIPDDDGQASSVAQTSDIDDDETNAWS